MNRRDFLNRCVSTMEGLTLSGSLLTTTGGVLFNQTADARSGHKLPNIVFIFIDDMGWRDVGFMGSRYYETPHIDKLAGQGMIFTNAYSNAPNCAPARACLMSGQYGPRHGVYTVSNSDRGPSKHRKLIPIENTTDLRSDIVTIAEALKPAGYISASMGKWHLGTDPELGPTGQGFDINVGGFSAGQPPKGYFVPYGNPELPDGPPGEYLTDRLTDEALKFIEANKNKPFFLYLPHYAVHTPLQAKAELVEKYKKKRGSGDQNNPTYAAMIESTDQGVGRIMDKLDELNLTDNTVVFFFSDNGGVRTITSNAPLRGGKGMLYEGGIREPMCVRWPGVVKAGTCCETPIIGVDYFPTLLEIARVRKPKGKLLDGESILPLLKGGNSLNREALFWHFPAYLQGRAEGARDPYFRTRPAGAIRAGDWKLIEYFEDGALELYNLKDDIGEKKNLANVMPDKTKELHQLMLAWRKATNAQVPTKPNPEYQL
ncbi:MAG: sulfatase [Sedimentisphaerales bacterium]|nr:sulfatase [Sedimentisphaerales bacterium]